MSAKHNDKPADARPKAEKFVPPEIKSDRPNAGNQPKDESSEAVELKKQLDEAGKKIAEMEEQLKELDEYKNEAARAKADFYNYRTRIERDRARDRVLAAEGACDTLMPVLDNLDRTIEAVGDKESALYKGVSMVQRQFLSALQNLGLKLIETDCDFDPKEHEALMMVDTEDEAEDGKIIDVLHKGYKLGDKVLRAAQVKVAKKK